MSDGRSTIPARCPRSPVAAFHLPDQRGGIASGLGYLFFVTGHCPTIAQAKVATRISNSGAAFFICPGFLSSLWPDEKWLEIKNHNSLAVSVSNEKREPRRLPWGFNLIDAPGTTRTCDLLVRSQAGKGFIAVHLVSLFVLFH